MRGTVVDFLLAALWAWLAWSAFRDGHGLASIQVALPGIIAIAALAEGVWRLVARNRSGPARTPWFGILLGVAAAVVGAMQVKTDPIAGAAIVLIGLVVSAIGLSQLNWRGTAGKA